jgi:prepilin-type N-terminal cleavage/methylation domain-containing protein
MKLEKSGFTLIELSIVLVIIALLVGGVVTGRELIKTAESRAILKQIENLNIVTQTFRNKYNGIPGDLANATNLGLVGWNGNGDGKVWDNVNQPYVGWLWAEPTQFFIHLYNAGLIPQRMYNGTNSNWIEQPGYGRQFLKIAVGNGGIMPSTYDGDLMWYYGLNVSPAFPSGLGPVHEYSTGGVITPAQAYYVDSKYDDGFPGAGDVFAVTNTNGALDTTNGNCVTNSALSYNVANDSIQCRIYVKAR